MSRKVLTSISFASSSSKCATEVVEFWRISALEESIAWSPIPNYQDAAKIVLADEFEGVFYFDASLPANSPSEVQKRKQSSDTK